MTGRSPFCLPRRLALAAALLAPALHGCAAGPERSPEPVGPAAAARLGRECPAGTFLGTMTINCPQRVE